LIPVPDATLGAVVPHLQFPNESAEYRTARNALLEAEVALRRQIEAVAAQRRALPPGGAPPEDFVDEPMYNVFRQDADGAVRHFWGSEMLYAPEDAGQNHRAGDLVDPVWGLLDMSPEGRGDFFPKLAYD
jgi:predicted dithiol-disulfide oxidoreductase (DUF899 family)